MNVRTNHTSSWQAMSPARLLLASLSTLFTAGVQASDWQYAGHVKASGVESHQFFDAETVSSPAKDVKRVWVKSIALRYLDRYYKMHQQLVVEKSARKLVSGYAPQFTGLAAIKSKYEASQLRDAMVEVTSYEIIANEPDIRTFSKLYFELDCAGQRIRLLDGTLYADSGDIKSMKSDRTNGEYQFIQPDSNGQWLSQLLCPHR